MAALLLFSYIWINVLGSVKNATGLLTLLYPTGMWWGLKIVKCFEFLGKKKALHECNRFPFVHIASGPTSVRLWYTGSDPECCTCVGLFTNINGDMAPAPRSLPRKELTWQPTKHTFCKALRGLFSTKQLRVRVETWSRRGERAQAEQWEDEQNPCCGKKDSNLEIKGCFECSSDVLHCVLAQWKCISCGNTLWDFDENRRNWSSSSETASF